MGYYYSSGVILGVHFREDEWTASRPELFYTENPVDVPAKQSCQCADRDGHKFCPSCGVKVKDKPAKTKIKRDWHSDPHEKLEEAELHEAGLSWFSYTDGEHTYVAVGVELVAINDIDIRSELISTSSSNNVTALQKLQETNLFTDEFIAGRFGTWFIQGGS